MANNPFLPQQRLPGHWGGYLLGARRTPPPPRPQDYAVAMMNHLLDGGQMHRNRDEEEESSVHVSCPCFLNLVVLRHASAATQIVVQVSVAKNIVNKINFPSDISQNDFLDRIYAAMNLDRQKDELGWKTCDEGDRAANHRLSSSLDVKDAIQTIVKMQSNPRRRKPVFLKITHLVWTQYNY